MLRSKLNKIGYSLKDISIVQSPVGEISHRSEVNPFITVCEREVYPIFVSPMASVTDEKNYKIWIENKVTPVIPRSIAISEYNKNGLNFSDRLTLSKKTFVSFGLQEASQIILQLPFREPHYICIDIANGTLESLYRLCKELKHVHGDNCIIMTGNVATPSAYRNYVSYGIDYMRVSIGTGSRCVTGSTLIKMANGNKKFIKDIKIGDIVKTISGAKRVINIFEFNTEKLIKVNDDIECTLDHKFLVIKKEDREKIVENNLMDFAFYLPSKDLTNDFLLVKEDDKISSINFERVKSVTIEDKQCSVYDIEVEDIHQYIANDYYVHNCTTACNTGTYYPVATLIDELHREKKKFEYLFSILGIFFPKFRKKRINLPKLILDGGISNFDDIQKAIALGADAVMVGNIFARAEEACGKILYGKSTQDIIDGNYFVEEDNFDKSQYKKFREYYGMSTKRAQKETGGVGNKTAEGISRPVEVEYPISKWIDNMASYLRSNMTYTNSKNIKELQKSKIIILGGSGDFQYRK